PSDSTTDLPLSSCPVTTRLIMPSPPPRRPCRPLRLHTRKSRESGHHGTPPHPLGTFTTAGQGGMVPAENTGRRSRRRTMSKPLTPIDLTATQQMILFGVGTGQIKLAAGLTPGRKYHPGGAIGDATGIRIYTLTYPDEAQVKARFKAAGYPEPVFKDIGGGKT